MTWLRCILYDKDRAGLIFSRIRDLLPQTIGTKTLAALHEKLRVLRYTKRNIYLYKKKREEDEGRVDKDKIVVEDYQVPEHTTV